MAKRFEIGHHNGAVLQEVVRTSAQIAEDLGKKRKANENLKWFAYGGFGVSASILGGIVTFADKIPEGLPTNLAWVGITIGAVTGLGGVIYTEVKGSKLNRELFRLERERDHSFNADALNTGVSIPHDFPELPMKNITPRG